MEESGGGRRGRRRDNVGSLLVKSLLQRGHKIHATIHVVQDFSAKCLHLLKLWGGGGDGLRFFEAVLQEEGSFDEPVRGCHGVFHVAASMQFSFPAQANIVAGRPYLTSLVPPSILVLLSSITVGYAVIYQLPYRTCREDLVSLEY